MSAMLCRPLTIAGGVIAVSMAAVSLAWATGQYVIDQSKLRFSATDLAVKKGSTVTFRNHDRTSHNIQISGGMSFDGGLQKPGEDLDVLFAKAGDYSVTCGIHPKMSLTVHAR